MVQQFEFHPTAISGLLMVTPFSAEDARGCFTKDYSREIFEMNGVQHELAETFYTTNHKGVLRGLHFQRVMQQPKLVRCICGHVWDVVVDLRKDSPTFKQWRGFDLVGDLYNEILVPAGCAHGYLVLENSIVSYKCAEKFFPQYDGGVKWDDPEFAIDWPLEKIGGREHLIVAEKDRALPTFHQFMETYGGF